MITQKQIFRKNICILLAGMAVLMFSKNVFAVTEIFLRADTTSMVMPDGRLVHMWGFAQDSAFEANDGTVTVPGPQLTIAASEPNLIIYLDNNLPEPVSLMIPGQITSVAPVTFEDGQGRDRIRSFTHETPSGNTEPVAYHWPNLRPGTFLYQSGSHPAVQVQMGLYGSLSKDFEQAGTDQAYEGIEYDQDHVVILSEIDPALHDAIETNNYGPGMSMTSTMDYNPKYFLVNGRAFTTVYVQVNGQVVDVIQPIISIGEEGDRIVLRMINAGIQSHVAVLDNLRGTVIAEDGYAYNYPSDLYAIDLPPAKTKDVLIVPDTEGVYTLYDRALQLTNDNALGGGMMVKLEVAPAPPPAPQPVAQETITPLGTDVDSAVKIPVAQPSADIDNDGIVNYRDVFIFIRHWQARTRQIDNNPADLNQDGVVDEKDAAVMIRQLQTGRDENVKKSQPALRKSSRRRARVRR